MSPLLGKFKKESQSFSHVILVKMMHRLHLTILQRKPLSNTDIHEEFCAGIMGKGLLNL